MARSATGQRLSRRIDDRLVFIETGVEKHGNAGDFFEFADQPAVQRVLGCIHRLQPACTVDVRDGGKDRSLVFADRINLLHEGIGRGIDEVVADGLFKNRWSEGTKLLAELDLHVDQVAHIGAAGIRKNAPVAQGASAPFHSSLKPADHMTLSQKARRRPAGLLAALESSHL